MKKSALGIWLAAGALSAAMLPQLAAAQGLDALKGALGGGDKAGGGSSMPSLGGMTSGMTSGSTGNVAGVLEFCVKNNYLSGDASSVKDQLISKISGGGAKPAEQDSGFLSGAKGMLTGSDGKSMDLSGDGLKKELTKKACDQVLAQGKKLL